jgi:hypothetical protein
VFHSTWLGHEKPAEGLELLDQALTAEIARWLKWTASVKVSIRCSYERSLPVAGLAAHFDADSMVAFMHRVIEGAAAEGNCVSCHLYAKIRRQGMAEPAPLSFDDQFQ